MSDIEYNSKHVRTHYKAYLVEVSKEEWEKNPHPDAAKIAAEELHVEEDRVTWNRMWDNLEHFNSSPGGPGAAYQAVVMVFPDR